MDNIVVEIITAVGAIIGAGIGASVPSWLAYHNQKRMHVLEQHEKLVIEHINAHERFSEAYNNFLSRCPHINKPLDMASSEYDDLKSNVFKTAANAYIVSGSEVRTRISEILASLDEFRAPPGVLGHPNPTPLYWVYLSAVSEESQSLRPKELKSIKRKHDFREDSKRRKASPKE